MDYSQEARKLWEKLGINPDQINEGRGYNLVDVVFRSPEGGCVYVGGERAARDLEMLREKKITSVVNCTDDLRNYHEKYLTYYTFNIAWWRRNVMGDTQKELQDFILPVLEFIEREVKLGHNVLVHCLAGAHRAGTTAILCLMHLAGLDSDKAITTARALRSMIEPIGDFRQLLARCNDMQRGKDGRFIR